MQRSLDLLALTKRLEMISTKPAVGRHFFRRFEFKGEKRRRSQAFYTGTSCLISLHNNIPVDWHQSRIISLALSCSLKCWRASRLKKITFFCRIETYWGLNDCNVIVSLRKKWQFDDYILKVQYNCKNNFLNRIFANRLWSWAATGLLPLNLGLFWFM